MHGMTCRKAIIFYEFYKKGSSIFFWDSSFLYCKQLITKYMQYMLFHLAG